MIVVDESTHKLELCRWFGAPIETIFDAFVNPERLRQWWGPHGFVIDEIDFPAEVGETFRVALHDTEGVRWTHVGRFLDVHRPTRLRYSFQWIEGPVDHGETLVDVRFRSEKGGTRVDVSHSRFADGPTREAHHDGWTVLLERLSALLACQP